MGGVDLALDGGDCRWLTDSDWKPLSREGFLREEVLALEDKLFIIIPGMVGKE
jgi:hypothetical protein